MVRSSSRVSLKSAGWGLSVGSTSLSEGFAVASGGLGVEVGVLGGEGRFVEGLRALSTGLREGVPVSSHSALTSGGVTPSGSFWTGLRGGGV